MLLFRICKLFLCVSLVFTSHTREGDEDPKPENNARATADNSRAHSPNPPASTEHTRQSRGGNTTPRATARSTKGTARGTAEAGEEGHTKHPSEQEQRREAEPEKTPQQNTEARRRRNAEGKETPKQSNGTKEEEQHRKHPQKNFAL